MEKATYFIVFTWTSARMDMQNKVSFGNGVIEEFPLIWLKKMQDSHRDKLIRLLWWKQLTNKDETEAAKGIGMTAI